MRLRRPYLHRTYRIDDDWSAAMAAECSAGNVGFTRVGLNYFIGDAVLEYILAAVHLLAEHAWKLLPLYRFDPATGLWRHCDARPAPTLADAPVAQAADDREHLLAQRLADVLRIVRALEARPPRAPGSETQLTAGFERIRWFPLPHEANAA